MSQLLRRCIGRGWLHSPKNCAPPLDKIVLGSLYGDGDGDGDVLAAHDHSRTDLIGYR